jgi:hypothetical protein
MQRKPKYIHLWALSHLHCWVTGGYYRSVYTIIDMSLQYPFNVRWSTDYNLPFSLSPQIVFPFLQPCDEAAGPLKSGLLLFSLVPWKMHVVSKNWFRGCLLPPANCSSLEACQRQNLLRWPNIQADLIILNRTSINTISNPCETYVLLIYSIVCGSLPRALMWGLNYISVINVNCWEQTKNLFIGKCQDSNLQPMEP